MTVDSGPLCIAVLVSMDVTEGDHRYKVAPVRFGAIFLVLQGGTLSIIKENSHVAGAAILKAKYQNFLGK